MNRSTSLGRTPLGYAAVKYWTAKKSIFLMALAMLPTVTNADVDPLRILGFSPDGKYMSFLFTNYPPESGVMDTELFILNVQSNTFAAKPVHLTIEAESNSGQKAQDKIIKDSYDLLRKYLIFPGNNMGQEVYSRPISGFANGQTYKSLINDSMLIKFDGKSVLLSTKPFQDESCGVASSKQPVGFQLKLINEKSSEVRIIQDDLTLPKSRQCPYDYRIRKIIRNQNWIAVFVAAFSTGFEGIPNIRYLACTGSFGYSSAEAEQIISDKAKHAILLIKTKDFEKLDTLIHPDKGVRFSPYSYVYLKNDIILKRQTIQGIFKNSEKLIFGGYDGSGEPIELTLQQYWDRFVYDCDFANAPQIAYNAIIRRGNTLNNNFEAYPDGIIVEYHFPGFKRELEGMDWRSLRLVFEKKDKSWYLVGVIHDQWTI